MNAVKRHGFSASIALKGHGFSRAAKARYRRGFSRWGTRIHGIPSAGRT